MPATPADLAHLLVDVRTDLLRHGAFAVFSPCAGCGEPTGVVDGGRCAACRTSLRYRYALGRYWGEQPPAVFVMLNPSTADAYVLDRTVRRCVGYAHTWRAGGVVVLNAFGLRSTDPRVLPTEPDPVGPDNDAVINWVLSWRACSPVVVAWGAHATLGGRDARVLELLRAGGFEPVRLGPPTKGGQPRHPLYLRRDVPLELHTAPASAVGR